MGHELKSALRPAIALLLLFTLLLGLAYPLAITGAAQALMPAKANGSLVSDGGRVVGSELIGQSFASPRYFNSRPSAAGTNGYDAAASSGSNLGPTSRALADRIRGDVAKARAAGVAGPIPADMVTASASGLDPHISPENALAQATRVAAARGLPTDRVRALVRANTERPTLGFLGGTRVNLLRLNRALDAQAADR